MPKPNLHIHRVVAVALAAVFVCLATGSQLASSANLHTTLISPWDDPTYALQESNYILNPSTYAVTAPSDVAPVLETAAETSGLWPALGTAANAATSGIVLPAAAGVVAFAAGWEIGTAINSWLGLSGDIGNFLNGTGGSGSAAITSDVWHYANFTSGGGLTYSITGPQYVLQGAATGCAGYSGAEEDIIFAGVGGVLNYPAIYAGNGLASGTSACTVGAVQNLSTIAAESQFSGDSVGVETYTGHDCAAQGGVTYSCNYLSRSVSQMASDLISSAPATYVAQPVTFGRTALPTQPNCSAGTSCNTAIVSALTGNLRAENQVNCALDPGAYVCPGAPGSGSNGGAVTSGATTSAQFTLPQPTPDETYITYTERLRNLGYLGSVTEVDDAMSEYPSSSYGARLLPQSLTSIQVGVGTIQYLYDQTTGNQVAWPTSPTVVTPGTITAIALGAVPASYNPLTHGATSSTETGAGAPVTLPGGTCNCPPINLAPFESLSVGSKFPFGVFGWLNTTLGSIPSSGTPMTFSVGYPLGGGTVVVNTASTVWETTYRPIVFPIAEFLMTLGMFCFFAFKIIGLGGGE